MKLQQTIIIPEKCKIIFLDKTIWVEGPSGSSDFVKIPEGIDVIDKNLKSNKLIFYCNSKLARNKNKAKSLLKTFNSLMNQSFQGVLLNYRIVLKLVGVGFRSLLKKELENKLVLKLGFSHDICLKIPNDLEILCPKSNVILIIGSNKQKVFNFASIIQKYKKPEPYKGKGILRRNENIRRKEGKRS
jgi:large subunit ribosomal protein L6